MKKEFLLCIASGLFALPSVAQQYEIIGKAPQGAKVVYLQNIESRTPDSVKVEHGTFTFKGDSKGRIFAVVGDKEQISHPVQVLLDGKVHVDLIDGIAKGTAENEKFTAWIQKMREPQQALTDLMTEVAQYQQNNATIPDSVTERINGVYEHSMQQMATLVKQCCKENVKYRFPAFFLLNMSSSMEKADVMSLAEQPGAVYMEVPVMEHLKDRINGWKKQMPGTKFTDLTMNNTLGQAQKLSDFVGKGKYVLIDFWASWCGPCRRSMPELKQVYNKYKDKNFEIIGLSFDQDKTAWLNSIKKMELPWIHLSDLKGWESVAAKIYGINSIPATLLIGPDGRIVASGLHAEELDARLSDLLK